MAQTDVKKEPVVLSDAIAGFIQKNRRIIIPVIIAALCVLVGLIAGFAIRDALEARAISQVEAFDERYETLRFDIADPARGEEVQTLLDDLEAFAKSPLRQGYPAARAYSMAASIQADLKKWTEAKEAWTAAARRGAKTYLGPISLFNAAVAAEEEGSLEEAIGYYTEITGSYKSAFPSAARAQFSIGRLREEQQNRTAALEAYRAVIDNWPSETVWTNLANSKIIALSGLSS
jgi:tetratricopeptide (TPR) repeat protein